MRECGARSLCSLLLKSPSQLPLGTSIASRADDWSRLNPPKCNLILSDRADLPSRTYSYCQQNKDIICQCRWWGTLAVREEDRWFDKSFKLTCHVAFLCTLSNCLSDEGFSEGELQQRGKDSLRADDSRARLLYLTNSLSRDRFP